MSLTPILALQIPVIGGDNNAWGAKLNADLVTLDSLGGAPVFNVASNFLMVAGIFPEAFYRVITGGLTVNGTLPDPGTIPVGKLFTVLLLDIGGSVKLACVNPAVTIGFAGGLTYFLNNQGAAVRLLANGASYDVVGVV